MKYIGIICLALLMSSAAAHGQCMMYELPLNLRTGEAAVVVEGSVTAKRSFIAGGRVYTAHSVAVHKVFKGEAGSVIEVITEGGRVGNKAMIVIPNLELTVGDAGIFFLENTGLRYEASPVLEQFSAFGSAQGFVRYDAVDGSATDAFHRYSNVKSELYAPILSQTGTAYRILSPLPTEKTAFDRTKAESTTAPQATISSFSPATVTAGTFTELTIRGSGFGSSATGSANVLFSNADAGGSGYITAPPDHIRSWKDNEIKVWVPGVSGATACTGPVRVVTSSGAAVSSSQQLTVAYSVIGYYFGSSFQSHLVDNNGAGGFTFSLYSNFASNAQAVAVLQRAMTTWRCASGINLGFERTPTTPISCAEEDGKNIIAFGSATCPMPQGTLGVTYIYPTEIPCITDSGQQRIYIKEMDMLFTPTPPTGGSWNYGPGATTGAKYDFESVVVHELGHVHQLGHINSPDKLMHYAEFPNKDVRQPSSESSLAGALNVMSRSVALNCGLPKIRPVSKTNCTHGSPAARIAVTGNTQGCAPLTVEFKDASYYTPTTWSWDADGDGKADFTSRDGSFTYTTVGTYTVRLRVSNGTGFDTTSTTIVVDPPPITSAGDNTLLCKDSSLQLSAVTTGGKKPYVYQWQPATGLDNPSTGSPIAKPSATTTYIVTATDRSGCIASDTITITVVEPTPAGIIQRGDSLEATSGRSYQWMLNGQPLAGATTRTFQPKVSGRYSVHIADSSTGCIVRSADFPVTIAGVDEITANDALVFPNPTDGILHFSLSATQTADVRVFSATGEIVTAETFPAGTLNPTLSLASMPSGVYIVAVRQGLHTQFTAAVKY